MNCNDVMFLTPDYDGDTLTYAFVQYTFDVEEHPVCFRPHGNSKRSEGFIRTMPSTLQKLKTVAKNLTPKFAVCNVSSEAGDIIGASSSGALPRNRQQVSNIRRRNEDSSDFSVLKKDPLFSVMVMCKESEGKKTGDHFVRIVTGAPEPILIVSFDWTLKDIERFCTGSEGTILSIDPTFNLGEFSVTVTSYKQLMLINSRGKHPVMIGPMFIHQRKEFKSYHFFASSLVGLNPALSNIRSFGTDGEKALSKAFTAVF